MPKGPPSPLLPAKLSWVELGGEQGWPPSLLLTPAPSPSLCTRRAALAASPALLPRPRPGAAGPRRPLCFPAHSLCPQPCLQPPALPTFLLSLGQHFLFHLGYAGSGVLGQGCSPSPRFPHIAPPRPFSPPLPTLLPYPLTPSLPTLPPPSLLSG